MTIHFGEFSLARTVGYYASQGSISSNLLAILSFLGGVTVFPWAVGGGRKTIAAGLLGAAALSFAAPWPSTLQRVWFIALAASGLLIITAFVVGVRRLTASGKNHGEAFLILWPPAVLVFFLVVADMVTARYILLAVPPLYFVVFGNAGERRLIFTLIPTAALSLVLAYTDFIFVNENRVLVERTIAPLQRQGFRVWSATESGLRFYLEQRGASSLSNQDVRPGPGDIVVRHNGLFGYSLSEPVATMLVTLKTFTLNNSFPVRTYSLAAGAGFHSSGAGLVPYTISSAPLDVVEISQMSPLMPAAVWSPDGPTYVQTEREREFPLKIPSDTKIEYESDGDGVVALTGDRIRLIKTGAPGITWRNFRIVPKHW
jgi:hypothetical protein